MDSGLFCLLLSSPGGRTSTIVWFVAFCSAGFEFNPCFDFFPFRVGLKKLKTPAKRSTNRKSRGWGRGVIRRSFGLRLISVMCTVTGY